MVEISTSYVPKGVTHILMERHRTHHVLIMAEKHCSPTGQTLFPSRFISKPCNRTGHSSVVKFRLSMLEAVGSTPPPGERESYVTHYSWLYFFLHNVYCCLSLIHMMVFVIIISTSFTIKSKLLPMWMRHLFIYIEESPEAGMLSACERHIASMC